MTSIDIKNINTPKKKLRNLDNVNFENKTETINR